MSHLSVHLFRYPQFLIDNKPIKVERRKTLALMVYLTVETGINCSPNAHDSVPIRTGQATLKGFGREALAALIWPDYPADKASAYMRQAIWDFSKAAGEEWLVKDGQAIGFNKDAHVWVDVNAFRELCTRQISGQHRQAASTDALTQLADIYQNDFLSGFTLPDSPEFDDWQALQTESLRLQFIQVLEELVDRLSAERKFDAGIQVAQRWLSLDPLNETCHRVLMQLYDDNHQRHAALQQFAVCAQQLKKELGIEPSNETVGLYNRLRTQNEDKPIPQEKKRDQGETLLVRPTGLERPHGTVTFLFTDIEGSTYLWEHHREAMEEAFRLQEGILRKAMTDHGGFVYKMIGDAFQVAFTTAAEALAAALAAQRGLLAEAWGETGRLKVRMALHTGVTEERENDYVGPTLNRVARILSAGYGDQILVNQPTYEQLRENLPPDVSFKDMGEKRLKDLVHLEHIYQVVAAGLPGQFPPLKGVEIAEKHLPAQPTAFIGRESELAEIDALLSSPDCRLVTLAGIGGSGKTRLAIQAASQSQVVTNNVYFVSLEGVTTSQGLLAAIADAVNLEGKVKEAGSPDRSPTQDLLSSYLGGQKTLLILDNFEQLIGCAGMLTDLLTAAPMLKMIVTSRERLNLPGEWVLEVLGLAYPGLGEMQNITRFPAVVLFLRTAERTSGFVPKETDWPAIMRICQLLEGVPLGIEMAAGWVRLITCQEVVEEVEKSMDFLSTSWRGLPERHRTIRAVFEYSWGLLSDQEKKIFSALSMFSGGFTREAAISVTGATLQVLSMLIDKSMVRRQSSGRYEIHPLLNQYAAEKLASVPEALKQAQNRYLDYFCDWISRMDVKLKGHNQGEALNLLRYDSKNLVTMWHWLVIQGDAGRLKQVLPAFLEYYEYNNRFSEYPQVAQLLFEMIQWLEQVCGSQESEWMNAPLADLYAMTLAGYRYFNYRIVGVQAMVPYQQKSVRIAEVLPDGSLKALSLLMNASGPGDYSGEEAIQLCRQSLAINRHLNNTWGEAMALIVLGDNALFKENDLITGWDCYQAGLAIFKDWGNEWGQGKCLFGLSCTKRMQGQLREAYELGLQSAGCFERINSRDSYFLGQMALADLAESLGQTAETRQHYDILLPFFKQVGDMKSYAVYLEKRSRLESLESARPV